MRTMGAGEFKAKCLGLISEANITGETIVITRRGKPSALLCPFEQKAPNEAPEAIFGCLSHMATVTGDIVSSEFTDEEWEKMFNEKWDRFDQGRAR